MKQELTPVGRPVCSVWALLALVLVLSQCSDAVDPPVVEEVLLSPDVLLLLELGEARTVSAELRDTNGNPVLGVPVIWSVDDPGVASIDSQSGVLTAVSEGRTLVHAQAGGATGEAGVEVYLAPPRAFAVGQPYFGRHGYVEYLPGNVPVVVSAPHGGDLEATEIPQRTFGVTAQDRRTQETARELISAIELRTGGRAPHLIINRLHRNRLDANREIVEAAQGSPFAELAWAEYHEFIDSAKARVTTANGRGLFLDLHGHGHPEQRLELGYLLSASQLNGSDAQLDGAVDGSSVRLLADESPLPFSALIRGSTSFGAMLVAVGVRSIPSPVEPSPGTEPYFTGGYNTARHGSRDGGAIDGIQLELNWTGIREADADREEFAADLAATLESFLAEHYGIDWSLGG